MSLVHSNFLFQGCDLFLQELSRPLLPSLKAVRHRSLEILIQTTGGSAKLMDSIQKQRASFEKDQPEILPTHESVLRDWMGESLTDERCREHFVSLMKVVLGEGEHNISHDPIHRWWIGFNPVDGSVFEEAMRYSRDEVVDPKTCGDEMHAIFLADRLNNRSMAFHMNQRDIEEKAPWEEMEEVWNELVEVWPSIRGLLIGAELMALEENGHFETFLNTTREFGTFLIHLLRINEIPNDLLKIFCFYASLKSEPFLNLYTLEP